MLLAVETSQYFQRNHWILDNTSLPRPSPIVTIIMTRRLLFEDHKGGCLPVTESWIPKRAESRPARADASGLVRAYETREAYTPRLAGVGSSVFRVSPCNAPVGAHVPAYSHACILLAPACACMVLDPRVSLTTGLQTLAASGRQ